MFPRARARGRGDAAPTKGSVHPRRYFVRCLRRREAPGGGDDDAADGAPRALEDAVASGRGEVRNDVSHKDLVSEQL